MAWEFEAMGPIMFAATPNAFCISPLVATLLNGAFAALFVYLIWEYFKRYYEVVRKLRPDLSGRQLLLAPMFHPFLIYGKEARALPERKGMWRPILILLAAYIPMALFNLALVDYLCP